MAISTPARVDLSKQIRRSLLGNLLSGCTSCNWRPITVEEERGQKRKEKKNLCMLQDHPLPAHHIPPTTFIFMSVLMKGTKWKCFHANLRPARRDVRGLHGIQSASFTRYEREKRKIQRRGGSSRNLLSTKRAFVQHKTQLRSAG